MVKNHTARKGIGCKYESYEGKIILCEYAEYTFGGCHKCIAPKHCWLDCKITKKFIQGKHCPNCSKPNNPHPLTPIGNRDKMCEQCKYTEKDMTRTIW